MAPTKDQKRRSASELAKGGEPLPGQNGSLAVRMATARRTYVSSQAGEAARVDLFGLPCELHLWQRIISALWHSTEATKPNSCVF
jgi:hypothetical protein